MPTTQTVFYMGRRVGKEDKIYHAFISGEDILCFSKARYCRIGYAYELEIRDDGRKYMADPPKLLGDVADDKDIKIWEVEDVLTDAFVKRKSDSSKAKRHPSVKKAVDALVPLCRGLSYHQIKCLVEHLVDQAHRSSRA